MKNPTRMMFAIIGALSTVLLLSACPKKVETTKGTAEVKEEKVAPPPEPMQPEVTPPPKVEETPVVREAPPMANLSDIHFDFDKYNIRDDMRSMIDGNGRWMKDNSGAHVTIEGHCDERGTNEYNLALGERRAQAAKRYLTALGIEASRISTISYGEERPICTAKDEACYAQNRRDHFATR